MTIRRSSYACDVRRWQFLVSLLGVLIGISVSASAVIDLNKDGVGDIWALFHSAEAQTPNADSDGDGLTNAQESAAGTDPRNPTSIIRVTSMSLDGSGLHLTFPTLAGKRYQVQSAASLSDAVWQNVGTALAGTGGDLTATSGAAGATQRFYRVLVQDVDTDGDGVTDWEELALGYDPTGARSSGIDGLDDLAAITKALQATNEVSVIAVEPLASEAGPKSGAFLITRSGNLNAIAVRYTISGGAVAGTDYVALSGVVNLGVGVNSARVTVTPLADFLLESAEAVTVTLKTDAAYHITSPSTATVLISDDVAPNAAGQGGLFAQFWNEASTGATAPSDTVAPSFPGTPVSRIDAKVDYDWPDSTVKGVGSPDAKINTNYFSSRWTGEVLPQYSQIYTFYFDVNRAGRVWVNGQLLINNWPGGPSAVGSSEYSGTIELQGGVRYPIVVEQYETTGSARARLSWKSANQPKEVIPQERLFADVPPQITSDTEVLLLKGSGPYTYQITASGKPTSFAATNLPPSWSFNALTGVLSGTPEQAGTWKIALTATNSVGTGSAILELTVIDTGGAISRDSWGNVAGSSVADIPVATAPASTSLVNRLEIPENTNANLGERLRGYLIAPATGTYQFLLSGDDAAELWISNDDEPINSFRRAALVAPGTAFRDWTNAAKAELLWLEAGKRYYLEVLHKQSSGTSHVSVGWIVPGSGATTPVIVPGFALSPYVAAATNTGDSTLYTTALTAQGGANTGGYGSSTLRMSADETQAILAFSYSNLTSQVSGKHVHSGAHGGEIIFDIDDATPRSDGSYVWNIESVGALSAAQVRQVIRNGDAYLNIHTANYPSGEIKGFFRQQAASQTFVPPGPAPTWTDDHTNRNAVSRFLIQATYGPSPKELDAANPESVLNLGYDGWIENQFAKAPTFHLPFVEANRNLISPSSPTYNGNLTFNAWWKNSVTAPDQLRQRVAFALSEIMVVSEAGELDDRGDALSDYYDLLLENAFGNFRDLLEAVTLHPAMGRYLDMYRNDKPDKTTGRIPNENYAREILQLFSIGLNRMWPDGSLMLSSKGELIPTYDQNAIIGFAHAFTGWDNYYTGDYRTSFGASSNYTNPMREVPARHFTGPKRILNNVVLPGMPTFNGKPLDPYASHSSISGLFTDATYRALPAAELDATHDSIFNHPNVGPFICRQLIQRLVTSTPSRGYIYRVVQKFNNNGSGIRGDMKAVVRAILLDPEARKPQVSTPQGTSIPQGYGKQREPLLRVTATARAFPAPAPVTGTYGQGQGIDPLNLIRVKTSSPHLYSNGNSVLLNFENGTSGDPDDAAYSISVVSSTEFTVRARSTDTIGSYSQVGNLLTFDMPSGNESAFKAGDSIYIDFTAGVPSAPPDGFYTVSTVRSDKLQFTARPAGSVSGTYSQTANVITFTSAGAHGFTVGSSVYVDFTAGTPDSAADGFYAVVSVSADGKSLTIAAKDSATRTAGDATISPAAVAVDRTGTTVNEVIPAYATLASHAVARRGNVAVTYSDWTVDSTDSDLNQTPLRSPTVFNFFEPDFQFPGTLAQNGLVTPEFQITSDTSVIRQMNFLYSGIFNEALGVKGVSGFRNSNSPRDIILDFRPWMGTNPANGLPWVHNDNLDAFIEQLNTLLVAGQLPAAAKPIIKNYVQTLPFTTPTETQLRDRVRAAIHLIVTSPDFTIQR